MSLSDPIGDMIARIKMQLQEIIEKLKFHRPNLKQRLLMFLKMKGILLTTK